MPSPRGRVPLCTRRAPAKRNEMGGGVSKKHSSPSRPLARLTPPIRSDTPPPPTRRPDAAPLPAQEREPQSPSNGTHSFHHNAAPPRRRGAPAGPHHPGRPRRPPARRHTPARRTLRGRWWPRRWTGARSRRCRRPGRGGRRRRGSEGEGEGERGRGRERERERRREGWGGWREREWMREGRRAPCTSRAPLSPIVMSSPHLQAVLNRDARVRDCVRRQGGKRC